MANFDREIDVSGLHCPMPILRAKKALADMSPGQVLHIVATDPASANDIPSFAKQMSHELVEARQDGGQYHYLIRKS
jgi:tRNA 2-thiouridine synthesizing protein A